MKVHQLGIPGAWLLQESRHVDVRGAFTRVGQFPELRELGLACDEAQLSYAHNTTAGTIRGMHYQLAPHHETKLIWCVSGAAFDVLVDLRPDSPTRGRWIASELTTADSLALLVPPGLAHGYQCLTDSTTLMYLISSAYHPPSARVLRWDDPTVGIAWPLPLGTISARDASAPPWPPEL